MMILSIISFTSAEATLQAAGGKGSNLARLKRAGFDVPDGFIIPTEAYHAFVNSNRLEDTIASSTAGIYADGSAQLEEASARIRAAFLRGNLPSDLEAAVREAYGRMNGAPVAVRSSATLEDLPDLSFAGQQDTYLNILGAEELLKAVIKCWSSLWTGRAIGYRMRNKVDHRAAALAVVVQKMVQSEVSGVLFTANPLSGLLSETVIDASFGLGEALVSGQVEPDHFVIDSVSGEIKIKTLGSKAISTRSQPGGGVGTFEEHGSSQQSLTGEQIRQLVTLGQQVQKEYGAPQDIEWAFADGQLYLLQSRPITSLFPIPEVSLDPLIVWFSFGAAQGIVGPITPLGMDGILHVAAGASSMFGTRVAPNQVRVFARSGERVWIRVSDLLRNPIGFRIVDGALGFIEPSVGQIIRLLLNDPNLGAGKGKLKLRTLRKTAGFFGPILVRLVRNMLQPVKARAEFDAAVESKLATAHILPGADRFERLANIIAFIRDRVANAFPFLLPRFIPVFGPSMGALNLLIKISGNRRELAMQTTRSLPNNVTTEMDLFLWKTAAAIRVDDESARAFASADAGALARQYFDGTLPATAQSAVKNFLDKYGMRGIGEIDMGQPRWREDPTYTMSALQSYLQIPLEAAPDVVFARGEQAALAAIDTLASEARHRHGGWLKEKLVRAAGRRIRVLMGARESPKFFAIRTMGIARQALLDVGKEFVEAGTLDCPDDLVFLKLAELDELSHQEPGDWKSLIHERRTTYERELRRRQVPRVLVSDGRAFYEGIGAQTDTGEVITGSPVSPGVAEGAIHVVLNPRGAHLVPGEILVCPGTDPAWTPLFLAAGGLVTEVGGMMTHGSVVAREYGIPAVVGVHEATLRLKDGQRVRLDGTTGKIIILDGTG